MANKSKKTPLAKLLTIAAGDPAVDAGELEEVLRLLHVPEDLEGTVRVAQNLCSIVQAVLDNRLTNEPTRFGRYRDALQWLGQNAGTLATQLFSRDADSRERFLRTVGKNPMLWQRAEKHGLWTLLWEDGPGGFRTLQLHATLSHLAVMKYWTSQPKWKLDSPAGSKLLKSLCRQTRAIRHFVMPRYENKQEYRGVLSDLVQAQFPVHDPISVLLSAAEPYRPAARDKKPRSIYQDLCTIVWLLTRASQPDKLRQTSPDRAPVIKYELDHSPAGDLDEDPEDDTDDVRDDEDDEEDNDEDESANSSAEPRLYHRSHWTQKDIDDCVNSGTHPEDALPRQSIYLSHRKSGARVGGGWAAMKNQLFPWSPEEIPLELVADGMLILKNAANRRGPEELELYARACVILRIGVTATAIRNMVVRSDYPEEFASLTLVLPVAGAAKRAEWVVPAIPLRLQTKAEPQTGCLDCLKEFVLPDYTGVSTVVRQLLNRQSRGTWNGDPVRPFDRPSVEFDRELRAFFSGNETLQSVFTFSRLAEVRFRRIYNCAHGSVVPATYLTGKKHPTGEVTRFYETLPIRVLQDLDKKSVAEMQKDLQTLGYPSQLDTAFKPSRSEKHVGSHLCPTKKALRHFFSDLRKEIEKLASSQSILDRASLIRRHNLYVTYTYAGYNLATGHRAVIGGYADPEQVELQDALFGIRDKGQRGRLVPMSAVVYAQMRACRDYLYGVDFVKKSALPLYLLDEDGNELEIRSASLREYLQFVPNFGRHYLCSTLTERILRGDDRIRIEYLKEFMGHAAEGEDRTSPHSAFDYRVYARSMGEVLDAVVEDVQYWPIDIQANRLSDYDFEVERSLTA